MRATLVALLVLVGAIDAQTVYQPTGGLTSYAGPSIPAPHSLQVYWLFLPATPPPPSGYPVLVDLNLLGFNRSKIPATITPAKGVLHDALEAGIAMVSASCTIVRGSGTGNPVTYPGNGVFLPPGAGIPPGYTGGAIAPYEDLTRPMPQKDAIMLVQHLKWNASSLGIDPTRMVARGVSASALIWMWCLVGPDRSDIWTNPQGQETESTRLASGLLIDVVTWWPALAQTKPPALFNGWHYPRAQPGNYDVLADDLAQADIAWQVEAIACDKLAWLMDVLDVATPDPWSALGSGVAGSSGVPALAGCGLLTPGSPLALTVTEGPSLGQVLLIGRFAYLGQPAYGGTLVPTPDVILWLPLDATGGLTVGVSVPAGLPSGASLYWQAWMPDSVAPLGYAATNGLQSFVP